MFYHRSLTDAERSRIICTALLVQGAASEELEVHSHTALNNGLNARELVALALSCILYTGFPRAINGLKTIQQVLASRGLEAEAKAAATGFLGQLPNEDPNDDPLLVIMRRGVAKTAAFKEMGAQSQRGVGYTNLGDVLQAAPDLQSLLMLGFGTHYNVPGITDIERAMTVVTSLMTLGTSPEELETHRLVGRWRSLSQ